MNNKKYLYQELTGKIIHCCMDVHNELGCGFLEKVYQEALAIVLKEDGIDFPDKKYYNVYTNNYNLSTDNWFDYTPGLLGDATKEVANTKINNIFLKYFILSILYKINYIFFTFFSN